ncbi:hypothetical protein QOZ80_9AG0676230 [Eleusine coracana subsp. coracana]|nr:hypothetical protein QOZ80_9AG0676230 [Eleusine coracana subsp. coracana]
MLLCCSPSPPRVQAFSPLPPLHPSCVLSSSGEQGRSKKSKQQRVKAQFFHAKVRSLRAQSHQVDGYCSAAEDPGGNLAGSAAPSLPDAEALASCLRSCGSLAGVRGVHAVALRKVFDEMPERSVVSWTAMMNGYRERGHHGEVRRLFLDMVASGAQGNGLTFVCLLKSCGQRRHASLGRQVHCCIVKGAWSNMIVDSAVAHFYAQCGDVTSASATFDRMVSRDVVSWTTMITVYVQHGHGDKALRVFSAMVSEGFHPNEFTVCSALKACAEEKALRYGKQLHGAVHTYAARILEAMPDRDAVAWTAMISGYNSLGHNVEALKLLDEMLWDGVTPNTYTYSSALKACARLEALRDGRRIHGVVNKTQAFSNVFVGCSLIDMYMRCGKVDEARQVFGAMPEHNLVTWKVIITGFAQNGLSEEALKYMYLMQQEGEVLGLLPNINKMWCNCTKTVVHVVK